MGCKTYAGGREAWERERERDEEGRVLGFTRHTHTHARTHTRLLSQPRRFGRFSLLCAYASLCSGTCSRMAEIGRDEMRLLARV